MATPKKSKKDFPDIPPSRGVLGRPGKMVKMIQARCKICAERGQGPRGWWDDCTHEPYHHYEPKPGIQTMEKRTDPETGEEGWFKRHLAQDEYVRVANWKQIAHDIKITSGRMVQIQIERGSKFPEELGYPPICDYKDCWEVNPSNHVTYAPTHEESDVRVPVGNYHNEDEAAIMVLRFEGVPIYIGADTALSRGNLTQRRKQLEEAKGRAR